MQLITKIDVFDLANHLAFTNRVAFLDIELCNPARDAAGDIDFRRLDDPDRVNCVSVRRRPEISRSKKVEAEQNCAQHNKSERAAKNLGHRGESLREFLCGASNPLRTKWPTSWLSSVT